MGSTASPVVMYEPELRPETCALNAAFRAFSPCTHRKLLVIHVWFPVNKKTLAEHRGYPRLSFGLIVGQSRENLRSSWPNVASRGTVNSN